MKTILLAIGLLLGLELSAQSTTIATYGELEPGEIICESFVFADQIVCLPGYKVWTYTVGLNRNDDYRNLGTYQGKMIPLKLKRLLDVLKCGDKLYFDVKLRDRRGTHRIQRLRYALSSKST